MKKFAFLVCFVATFVAVPAAVADGGAGVGAQSEAERFMQMYFAPMDGANFFRLYVPGTGMVEFRRHWRDGTIVGAGGWSVVREPTGDMTVREPGSPASYTFRKGRPFSMVSSQGKRLNVKFDDEPVIPGQIPTMWEGAEEDARESVVKKFTGNRLRLFYVNPNHAALLLAELALLGLFAFLFGRGNKIVAAVIVTAGAVVFAAASYFLVKTGGRGAALGLALGSLLMLGFRFFRRGGKIRAALVSMLVIAAAVAFFIGADFGGRFSKKLSLVAVERSEMWPFVPRMMVDSPGGWGGTRAGRAYSDWYQPLSSKFITPSLDSDHLTYMTGVGWVGRFIWGLIWFGVLFALFRFSVGGGSPLPLAQFSAVALAAVFNPLIHVWSLWIIPVASLWPFAASRPWKMPKKYIVPLVSAAVASLAVCVAFYWAGREPSRLAVLPIKADGGRVLVGSRNPDVWIADDRYSIGWLFAPKEIRYFYSAHPGAKPLGHVQRLSDLPPRVRRLAVAGRLCREYVKLWNEGKAPKVAELIFLSPAMPLQAIPESLRRSCKFAMVVGEFAARYVDVYGHIDTADGGVLVTEGAEAYLPGWVGLVLSL